MLCERKCLADRMGGKLGFCRSSFEPKIARAALHFFEEPIISGTRGSGAIFFSGCSLSCIYCQNREISSLGFGKSVSSERLCEIMLSLEAQGAHNINLVTPTHFIPSVLESLSLARQRGLALPIVYNTSSYESAEALNMLSGKIDVYLPDLKYYRSTLSERYSGVKDYPEVARRNIDIMVKQRGRARVNEEGIITSGVVVRLLLLPSALADTKLNLKYLFDRYGDDIYISLMSQYTPREEMPPPLDRRVTAAEYDELLEYAYKLGVKRAFSQERDSANSVYTPPFDLTGVNN